MDTIITVILTSMVLISAALIALVMIQQGKGADMGAAFGSGAANTFFGSSGASSTLTRMTAWLAVAFFVLCFAMAHFTRQQVNNMSAEGVPEAVEQAQVPTVLETVPENPLSDVPGIVPVEDQ